MDPVPVTIFSDFTCPFCYVTEAGLRRRAAEGGIRIEYRSYELFPAPEQPGPIEEPARLGALLPLAEEVEVTLNRPALRPRTRKAHEAAWFARQHGVEDALREAIYAAYWTTERDIGRIDVLLELAEPLGLDPAALKIALDIDQFADSVLADQALARRAGVTAVPALIIGAGGGAQVLLGARPYAALCETIAQVAARAP